MSHFLKSLDRDLLRVVCDFAKKEKVKLYLVGGYLRDIILKRDRNGPDIDFTLKKEAIKFGRKLSQRIKAGFVVLDKEHGCCRLVKKINNKSYTLDFADFRGKNLEDDLYLRDFTINCLAAELEKALTAGNLDEILIDPHEAKKDLGRKIIRVANKKCLDDDPLRILRAFSLSAIFNFKIDKDTLKLIKAKKEKLKNVSPERIRDELFKILEQPGAYSYLAQLDKIKVLKYIIPQIEVMRGVNQGPYHHLDVWGHSLESLKQLDNIFIQLRCDHDLENYLNASLSGSRSRAALIRLGTLLHDIGKPKARRRQKGKTIFHGHETIGAYLTKEIGKALKLSNDEVTALKNMVFWHLRPGYMADAEYLTPRAKFRFFRDTACEAASVLLLSLADQRATRGPLTNKQSRQAHERVVSGLIKEFFRKKKEKKLVRLLNGNDIMRKLKISSGPLVGKILSEIEELQATGKIKTKKEALAAARKIKGKIK